MNTPHFTYYINCDRSAGRPVAPVLNNDQLHITGAGKYLEPGVFILDPWGFIVYNKPIGPTARKSVQGRLLYHL